jgi:hypothetical protein
MAIIFDVVLALSKGIPELDCPVTRTRHDLSVVCAEANGQDIGCVTDKATGSGTSIEIPQTQSVVPGRGEGKLAI